MSGLHPINDPSNPDIELREHLHNLLSRTWHDAGRLDAELRELTGKSAPTLYHDLMLELATLDVDPDEGASLWAAVVQRQREMTGSLGRPVDLRPALLDCLLEAQVMHQPKIVEVGAFEELRESVHRDGLTGLFNYRFFDEHLRRELGRCSRRMSPVSLAMIDIDHFKQVNDRFGHEAGNQALIAVSRVIVHCVRTNDVCARYGGEEFAVVLSEANKAESVDALERVRRLVEEECEEISGIELPQPLTISVGIATYPGDAMEAPDLIVAADAALYAAKEEGRNRVRVHGDKARSYRRASIRLDGRFLNGGGGGEAFRTTSVGDGGVSMILDTARAVGSVVEISLQLPDRQGEVQLTGRVVYAKPAAAGGFETGIKNIDVDRDGRVALMTLLEGHGSD